MSEYSKYYDEESERYVARNCYKRIAVSSPRMQNGENPVEFIDSNVQDRLLPDDIVVLSSVSLAVSQGRFLRTDEITVSRFAGFVARRMGKLASPGRLGSPEFIEAVYQCCGGFRLFFAWIFGKISARRGDRELFFSIAGNDTEYMRLSEIGDDGIPVVVYKPLNAERIAMRASEKCGARVAVAIVNPGKKHVVACSDRLLDYDEIEDILFGKPAEINGKEMPLCIIRAV
ncbi:MAG: hypothetical protein J5850_01940 [Clostridia bacterium]|nr:hypothetical protein [Clostridia bacterium]